MAALAGTLLFLLILFPREADARDGHHSAASGKPKLIKVGAMVALETTIGKMAKAAIEIAQQDINADKTILSSTHFYVDLRDSTLDALTGAFAGLKLMRNESVAIVGPQTSVVSEFVAKLAEHAHVPLLSFATSSPSLSMHKYPYFMRLSLSDALSMQAIACVIKHFGWREVVLLFQENELGEGAIPTFNDALRDANSRLSYSAPLPPTANESIVREVLINITKQESMVIVVNIRPDSVKQLFTIAKDLGMTGTDYVWIVSNDVASLMESFDEQTLSLMRGVLGVRTALPDETQPVLNFSSRWKKRFVEENPGFVNDPNINMFSLLAYDAIWVVARALDPVIKSGNLNTFSNGILSPNSFSVNIFSVGEQLKREILKVDFRGVSGRVRLNQNGEPLNETLEIVNVANGAVRVVGFWDGDHDPSIRDDSIEWPSRTQPIPRGWSIPADPERKLRVGVPWDPGFPQFVNYDPNTGNFSGFSIEVFKAAINNMSHRLAVEFIVHGNGTVFPGYYDDLVYQVYLGVYDAAVGDITVLANRSKYVDFTQPYTESGLVMTVKVEESRSNLWAILRPFTPDLWMATVALFFFNGVVVWLLEHRWNSRFRGPPTRQMKTILWFSFNTMFFTHREKLISNLARLVMVIWLFAVMVLVSSYTANLSSVLTAREMQPQVHDLQTVINKGYRIGYHQGSFVDKFLGQKFKIKEQLLVPFASEKQYAEALQKGPKHGGVAAIFEEKAVSANIPSLIGCDKYQQVGETFRTSGFSFVFPKGSPLVPDVSKAVLSVSESKEMQRMRDKWFGKNKCDPSKSSWKSSQLRLEDMWGVFVITGSVSVIAMIYHLACVSCRFAETPRGQYAEEAGRIGPFPLLIIVRHVGRRRDNMKRLGYCDDMSFGMRSRRFPETPHAEFAERQGE